jgi:hypothetical protein
VDKRAPSGVSKGSRIFLKERPPFARGRSRLGAHVSASRLAGIRCHAAADTVVECRVGERVVETVDTNWAATAYLKGERVGLTEAGEEHVDGFTSACGVSMPFGPQPPMDPAVAMRRADNAVGEFTTARTQLEAFARAGSPVSGADLSRLRLLKLHAVLAAMESRQAVDRSLERL